MSAGTVADEGWGGSSGDHVYQCRLAGCGYYSQTKGSLPFSTGQHLFTICWFVRKLKKRRKCCQYRRKRTVIFINVPQAWPKDQFRSQRRKKKEKNTVRMNGNNNNTQWTDWQTHRETDRKSVGGREGVVRFSSEFSSKAPIVLMQ